ncbi:MAG: phosphatidylglycerol lysyltransferase domain-containing protein [Candidatus Omnitrophota bacterium]
MELIPFSFSDKKIFQVYLKNNPRSLANYSFENNFIWDSLFELRRAVVNNRPCIFFQDKIGIFMNLPPLGGLDKKTVNACFEAMEEINHNKDISRIENIEEVDLGFFKKNGFKVYEKSKEYIVTTSDIAFLSGERFKHKRSLYNHFVKNYEARGARFRDYCRQDREAVLELYQKWMKGRMEKNSDPVYQGMLVDSFKVLSRMLSLSEELGITIRVVECNGKIIALSSGFPISERLFCVNFEIADLEFRGVSQFVFSEFAKTLASYRELNIMDDSGIENIRQTKLSYRPSRVIASYTALLP